MPSGLDALKKKAAGETSKKSKIPIVELPAALIVKAANLEATYRSLKTAESDFSIAEGDLSPDLLQIHSDQCKRDKELYASIKFHAKDSKVDVNGTFTVKRQLCKISADQEETLRTEFEEDYDHLFNQETTVSVDLKKLSPETAKKIVTLLLTKLSKLEVNFTDLDNKTAEKLLDLDGDNRAVEVSTEIKPTDQYFQRVMFDDVLAAKNDRMKQNGVLKSYKPSFKL